MNELKYGDRCGSVTKVDLMDRLDRFATLATRLDFLEVTTNSLESHACHARHAINEDRSTSISKSLVVSGNKLCLEWLRIVMDEGHIEPSQPLIGRSVGWPERKVSIKSLWIDFCCWFRKQQTDLEMPEELLFYELLDRLFIRCGDKYEFPPFEQCRTTFAILRGAYESD